MRQAKGTKTMNRIEIFAKVNGGLDQQAASFQYISEATKFCCILSKTYPAVFCLEQNSFGQWWVGVHRNQQNIMSVMFDTENEAFQFMRRVIF
jgi:hypothetical protein